MSKKRKYSENYVAFGFTFVTDSDGSQRPQCFLCGKVLANASLKPAKLKEHFISIHPKNALDSVDFFRSKKARFEKSGTLPKFGFIKTQKPCLEASYKVAYRIAKEKKAHTIGETLIKPCALEMTELVCGTEQRKKLEAVSLSNDTISSRIIDISNNILKQVMEELKASPFPFSMQLDESTDVSQCAQLLVYVRYMHADTIKEEFLFCEPLSETTKAADVLEMVNNFFAKQDFNWKRNIGSLCTDGAPAMLGKTSGFASLVKKEAPHIIVTHCFLHRHALASKTLSPALKEILSVSVKIVNFVRARALNNRIFKRLCQEMGAQHEVLLYHTEVRWLSRGQVLKRLMELRKEVSFFLREKQNPLSVQFDRKEFIYGLAYLADIFGHLNEVNLSFQGPDVTIMDVTERLQAFQAKLPLWKRRLETDNFANFPMLEEVISQSRIDNTEGLLSSLRGNMCENLDRLQQSFESYCSHDPNFELWIRNPFLADLNSIGDDDLAKDDLIELRTMQMLRSEFNSKNLAEFWCSLAQAYPRLVKRAMVALIPFATTYLCEAGFSALLAIKTKQRNWLDAKDNMRVALAKTVPQFRVLVEDKQEQPSH